MTTDTQDIQTARDIADADGVPLGPSWTELDQVLHGLREIEQIADTRLRPLGLGELADRIVRHTKIQRRWIMAHT